MLPHRRGVRRSAVETAAFWGGRISGRRRIETFWRTMSPRGKGLALADSIRKRAGCFDLSEFPDKELDSRAFTRERAYPCPEMKEGTAASDECRDRPVPSLFLYEPFNVLLRTMACSPRNNGQLEEFDIVSLPPPFVRDTFVDLVCKLSIGPVRGLSTSYRVRKGEKDYSPCPNMPLYQLKISEVLTNLQGGNPMVPRIHTGRCPTTQHGIVRDLGSPTR